ncbi:MAG: hypothetical protein ACRDJN_23275 [Chloroflexota bacterium]
MTAVLGDRTAVSSEQDDATEVLTPEEGQRLLDEQARRYLGMSGAEFVRAWKAGKFAADPDRPEVVRLAMLLPLAA